MKRTRLAAAALSAAMLLSLAACGPKEEPVPSPDATPSGTPTAGAYKPGTYEVSADGHGGTLVLSVTFDADAITDITVKEHSESEGLGTTALDKLIPVIKEKQSVNVDTVAGATVTSEAILEAVSSAIVQAGGTVDAPAPSPTPSATPDTPTGETVAKDVDIVIVGSGVAGMSAAVEASATGKSVLVLEKMPMLGGDSAICSGNVYATGSQVQRDLGLNDYGTVEELRDFYITQGDGHVDPAWCQFVAEHSGESVDWLAGMGATFMPRSPESSHRSIISETSGVGLVNVLADQAEKNGVEIMTETRATELIYEGGEVTGVRAVNGDTQLNVTAKSVVLATGGYDGSDEAKAKYAPGSVGHHSNSSVGNVGDGIEMVQEIGGKIVLKGGLSGISLVGDQPLNSPLSGLRMIRTCVAVSDLGYRYANESMTSAFDYYNPMVRTGRAQFYNIVDSTIPNELYDQAVEANCAFKADTIKELGELAGIPWYTLQTTIDDYNALCAAGEDTAFGKDPADLQPLVKAPFYCIKITPNTNDTFGGVVTDLDTRVLDENDRPIPNLYAAGAVSNGELFYLRYPVSGSSLNMCTTFGRVAGSMALANAD